MSGSIPPEIATTGPLTEPMDPTGGMVVGSLATEDAAPATNVASALGSMGVAGGDGSAEGTSASGPGAGAGALGVGVGVTVPSVPPLPLPILPPSAWQTEYERVRQLYRARQTRAALYGQQSERRRLVRPSLLPPAVRVAPAPHARRYSRRLLGRRQMAGMRANAAVARGLILDLTGSD